MNLEDSFPLYTEFSFHTIVCCHIYKFNKYLSVLSVCVLYYSLVTSEVASRLETGRQGGVGGVQQMDLEDAQEKIK